MKKTIFLILTFLMAILYCIYSPVPYHTIGGSMVPTVLHNDTVIGVSSTKIERGDIVVINMIDRLLIKRVVGLPGETIEIFDGITFINNSPIEEHYVVFNMPKLHFKCILDNNQYLNILKIS